MAGNISIRLSLDGALELKQQLEGAGNVGGVALEKLRAGIERLGAQDSGAVVQALQRITQAAQQAQAAVGQAQANAFAGVQSPVSTVDYKSRSADLAAYGASLDALRAKYNPLYAASKAYESTLDEIASAEKVGAISAAEATAARDRVTASFAQSQAPIKASSAALKEVTTSSGAASASMRGLGIQTIQAISGIATGQPILTTFIQQGHQVADQALAMGTGFGGIATAAKGMLAAIGGIPTLLGVGVVGGLGLMVRAADESAGRLNSLKVVLKATHDDYATLAQGVEDAAKRVSASSGLGFADALAAAKTIAAGRYFSGTATDIERLTHAAEDLGTVMGGGAAQGSKILFEAQDGVSKAAHSLSGILSTTLTPELLRQIDLTEKAGNKNAAYTLFLKAVESATKGAARDGLSPMSKAWQDLGNAFTSSTTGWHPFIEGLAGGVTVTIQNTAKEVKFLVDALHTLRDASIAVGNIPNMVRQQAAAGGVDNDGMPIGSATGQAVSAAIPTTSATKEAFIASWTDAAKQAGSQLGVSPSVLLAQWGLETGWGKSAYGNNLGNIKPGAGYTGDTYTNPGDGQQYRKYADPAAFAADFVAVVQQKWPDAKNTGTNAAAYAAALHPGQQGGYAEDPNYAAKLTGAAATVGVAASAEMVSTQKGLNDELAKTIEASRQFKDLQLKAEYTDIDAALKKEAATHGTDTAAYAALTQAAQKNTAERYANVDALTASQRESESALRASKGLTAAEQGLSAAIETRRQVAIAAGAGFSDQDKSQAENNYLRQQSQEYGRVTFAMTQAAAQSSELAAAYGQGNQAVIEVTARQQAYNESIQLFPRGSILAERAMASLIGFYEQAAHKAAELAVAQATLQNREQLTYLDAQTKSLGMNDNARSAYLDHLKAEQFLASKNIDLTSAQGAAYLASVDKISAASVALKGQEAALGELTNFVDGTFNTISDSIVSAFATGEQSAVKFKDVAASVVKAVEAELLKLALINPLKDLLLGSTSPNLLSVGGVLGKLLGNAGSSSSGSGTSVFDGPGVNFGDQIGSSVSSSGSSGLGLSDVAGAAGTLGTLGKAADYLTGGHLVSDLSSGIKDTFNQISNTSLYSSAPTAGGLTVPAGAADDVATATGSVANPTGSLNGVNINVGSAVGIVGGLYSAYSGFERGGVGGTVQGIGGIASAGFAAAGAGLLGSGAAGLAAAAGPYAPIALAAIAIIGALLPGAHPIHPFQDTEVDATGGHLTVGKTVSQVETTTAAVQAVNDYSASLDQFMTKAGLKLTNLDGVIGHVGENITGLVQVSSPDALFNKLSFGNDPSDTSNFGVAKGALQGMSFNTFQDLGAELQKIAAFSDAASVIGLKLQSVSTDISNIQIASVDQNAAAAKTTVKDAQGSDVTYDSDLRRALQSDLPGKTFANVQALDDEIASVSAFITQSLPQLLTPTKVTQSSVQDSIQASNQRYTDAIGRDQSLGLGNTAVLSTARDQAIAILMKPALDALNTSLTSIAGRGQALLYGQAGSGQATMANLAQTQNNERSSLYDTIHQTFGDNQVATDNYNRALQALITTQNAETEATRQQMQLAQEQGLASLKASEADIAKRAGIDSLAQQLSAYDAKATAETDTFIASWRAYYGQYAAVGEDFQNQMSALWLAHNNERLQIEQDYNTQSATQSSAALKTAQGSVSSLFGSIKDYALKLQTGSQSALSPPSQYDLAKNQFNAVAGAAAAGDAASAQQLTTYADAFLSTSREVNDSGVKYADDYNRVIDALQGVTMNVDGLTQSFMQQQLQSQTDQVVATLQSTTADLKAEISALRREVQHQAMGLMQNG